MQRAQPASNPTNRPKTQKNSEDECGELRPRKSELEVTSTHIITFDMAICGKRNPYKFVKLWHLANVGILCVHKNTHG